MSGVTRYRLIRFAGFVGAVLLAVDAYLGGALPDLQMGVTPLNIARGPNGPAILGLWFVGTAAITWAWWAARDEAPPARWVYVTVGLWLLPLLVAPPLGSRDVYAYACQGATVAAGYDPYQQGVAALPCPWLDSISPIWRNTPAPYGPLFVLVSGGVVRATDSLTMIIVVFRVIALLGVALAALTLPVLARRCGVPAGRALWLVLACPLVVVHLVSGAHNDALMIGLLVAGLAVIASCPGRVPALVAGGLLLGLAAGIKATAGVVVPFAALAAVGGPYRWRALLRDGGYVVLGALAAMAAVTLAGVGLGWITGLASSGVSVQWTSPPTAVGQTIGYLSRIFGANVNAVPATRVVGLVVLLILLAVLWWRLRPRPTGPPGDVTRAALVAAGLALAATVALSPVFHPWYATWPLAVLAATTLHNRWLAVVCAVTSFLVLPDGTGLARYTKFPGAPIMTVLIVLVVVRWIRRARSEAQAAARLDNPVSG
jgi:alpha-1,6-mannosyltransferase